MKKIIALLSFTILVSCGKSTYYVYEEYNYNPDFRQNYLYSYCALEITSKKEVIFRGASRRYDIIDKKITYFDGNTSEYVYIYCDKESSLIDNYGIYFCRRPSVCHYFSLDYAQVNKNKYEFKDAVINDFNHWENQYIEYKYNEKNKDSIVLSKTQDVINFIKNDTGFRHANIPWFPPYLIKVKRIEYDNFKKKCSSLKESQFKDPRKFLGKVIHVDKSY